MAERMGRVGGVRGVERVRSPHGMTERMGTPHGMAKRMEGI